MSLEPIAIIGIGSRFPGADNTESFWQLIKNGVDAITEVPKERWNIDFYYDCDPHKPNKANTRWGGFLKNIDQFEPQFFGISPREATVIDPQQRLLLEVSYEALEDAGQIPEKLTRQPVGVFIGIGTHDYSILMWQKPVNEGLATTGTGNCIAANRISYVFDFKGPSIAVDTACSSSLVSVHLACQSIWSGESTLALAGGVNVLLLPTLTVGFSKGGFLSPDGRCKSFDAEANGYVRSEGAGIVILKPLSQAQAEGDSIYAVIRGSALNQDGSTNGMAAPNPQAQETVLRQAYRQARIEPSQVQYIEAHGTGTKVGDRMELQALGAVMAENRPLGDYCLIGSVKSNIGHAETAAGIAGLIKVALCLHHQQIPPSLHCQQPNPSVDWDKLKLRVQQNLTPWYKGENPAIAGINSFGFGGTNAHLVLQEVPQLLTNKNKKNADYPLQILTLSAKSENALKELVQRYQNFLLSHPEINLTDFCYTLNNKRQKFNHRLALVADILSDLHQQLELFINEKENHNYHKVTNNKTPQIVFLFTGQGSQYVNMVKQLYQTEPTFRKTLNRCFKILKPYLSESISKIIFPSKKKEKYATDKINETAYTQTALFAIEYSLAKLWMSWGIKPTVLLGHSVGEYVAACLAGVFSLEDGLKLIAARGKLMQKLPSGGAMLVVLASLELVTEVINPYKKKVTIAAINSKNNIVISGKQEVIKKLVTELTAKNIKTTQLKVSHAFHSPLMKPMLKEFKKVAAKITYHVPKIELFSNITGEIISEEIATPEYWCKHILASVNFAASINNLQKKGYQIFLEIGAKPTLLGMAKESLNTDDILLLPSLRFNTDDWQQMLSSLAQLYLHNVKVNWDNFYQYSSPQILHLPSYPFQRQSYWWKDAKLQEDSLQDYQNFVTHPLLGQKIVTNSDETIFQLEISKDNPAYLKDHIVLDKVILPATAYLEMIYAAGSYMYKSDKLILKDFHIEAPLILSDKKTIKIVINSDYKVEIFSLTDNSQFTTLHASGNIINQTINNYNLLDFSTLNNSKQEINVSEYYQQMEKQGLKYGKSFQGIKQLWVQEKQAIGKIELPLDLGEELSNYHLHPVLLDSCLQVLGASFNEEEKNNTYLPIALESLEIFSPCIPIVWSQVKVKSSNNSQNKLVDITLFNQKGEPIAQLNGLLLKYVNQKLENKEDLKDWLYELNWQQKPLINQNKNIEINSWLIFADNRGLAEELTNLLKQASKKCILVFAGANYHKIDHDNYYLNPNNSEDFKQLFQDIDNYQGILHLWGLDSDISSENCQIEKIQNTNCASILNLIKFCNTSQVNRLWLVTKRSQSLHQKNLQPQQASVWGLGKVINLEYPQLNCTCLDLETEDTQLFYDELCFSDRENQIAYFQNNRYVARLIKHQSQTENKPLQLQISEYGVLDNLSTIPMTHNSPKMGEVEIQVYGAGVNFRDVLNALGMLQEFLEKMGFKNAAEIPFGGECAGKIVRVGAAVKGLKIGDEVIAVCALGSLASFVTVNAQFVVIKPQQLSFIEAATIPTTFLTAYYGLYYQAKLQKEERILIHAAAGGVGQAAVQLAQLSGAEIYATASENKWDFLKSLGLKYVMNSRSLDFAEEIKQYTENVDVILNSLNGEFIPKSLEILSNNGRFVEIGKIGIWQESEVKNKKPNIGYFPFDLLEISQQNPALINSLLNELMQLFATGKLKPLPHQVFPLEDAAVAFRTMAQAKHIGKIVITIPQPNSLDTLIKQGCSYLITGAMGALGLQVAEWLISKGATHLILIGRNKNQEKIKQLENKGAEISFIEADVTNFEQVEQIIQSYGNIKGIVHAAGVLRDRLIPNLTWEEFEQVTNPKIQGAWNLHYLTKGLPLDFFICFSSIVSVIGSVGQANYAAANAFLDGLAHYRHQLGLPSLTVNWGAWADAGMAATKEEDKQKWDNLGITTINAEQGFYILEQLLIKNLNQVGVIKVNWSEFLNKTRQNLDLSYFEKLLLKTKSEKVTNSPFIKQLATVNVDERQNFILNIICSQLAKVLGFSSPDNIDSDTNFSDLGMDSLMAVELKNSLQNSLEIPLETNILFDYPTVSSLANYLLPLLPEIEREIIPQVENITEQSLDIPPAYYQFELTSEYLDLKADLNIAQRIGNNFFVPHEDIANNTITIKGQELINYSSYNYLGLCGDLRIAEAVQQAVAQYGTSVCASRVLSGEISLHQELEREIADFLGTEDAIAYIGGHATNVSTIGHLMGKRDLIIYDSLSHNSIRQGCQLSGATLMEFPHNNWPALESILKQFRHQYEKVLIAIEGIYSTDGDIAPLPEIIAVKKQYKAWLIVDEAHSIGVLGKSGTGIGEYFSVNRNDVDMWMGTLSKSFASCGGYIAASKTLVEYLKFTAPGFVFSVGMSPANTAAALTALRLLKQEPERVNLLQQRAKLFLELAKHKGFNTGENNQISPIIPIIIGDRDRALRLSNLLFEKGIYVQPMVYPSVPLNSARLRFFISSTHTEEQIKYTIETCANNLDIKA